MFCGLPVEWEKMENSNFYARIRALIYRRIRRHKNPPPKAVMEAREFIHVSSRKKFSTTSRYCIFSMLNLHARFQGTTTNKSQLLRFAPAVATRMRNPGCRPTCLYGSGSLMFSQNGTQAPHLSVH